MKPPCKGHYRGYQPPSHRGLLKPEQPVIEDYLQDPKNKTISTIIMTGLKM